MKRPSAPELPARQHLAWASDFSWLCGIAATLFLVMYVATVYGWPVSLGIVGILCLLVWSAYVFPHARRAAGTTLRHIGSLQLIILIVLVSSYVQNFFPDIAIRDWRTVEQSPANPVNLIRIGLIAVAGAISIGVALLRSPAAGLLSAGPLRWMFLYAAVAVASASYASLPLVSVGKAAEVMGDVLCFLVLASLLCADDFLRSWNMLWMVISSLLLCVWGSAFLFPPVGFQQQIPPSMFPSLIGVYPQIHWNDLGQLGAGLAVVALCKLLRPGSVLVSKAGLFWGGMCLFGLATVLAAQARTSVVALAFAVPVCLYLYRRFTPLAVYLGFAGIVALIGAYGGTLIGGGAGDFVLQYLRRGESNELIYSLTGRTDYWLRAWNSFLTSPLLGHGFYSAHRIDLNLAWGALDVSNVDNTFLEVLLGVGIIGLFPLVIALAVLIRRSLQTSKQLLVGSALANGHNEMIGFLVVALVRAATGPTFQVHGVNLILLLAIMAFVQSVTAGRLSRPANAPSSTSSEYSLMTPNLVGSRT